MNNNVCSILNDADIASLKNITSTAERIKRFKNILEKADKQQRCEFAAGKSSVALVHARANIIDTVLQLAWKFFLTAESSIDDPALVAVGGYGRSELHPGSDIDIMLLLPGDDAKQLQSSISDFLTFLWDIGLEVGQSVRSVSDCVCQAETDITVATNLMESRLVYGSQKLFEKMRLLVDPDHIWPSKDFFEAKWKEQIERHIKFDDTAYKLEPNIKESPGGLRDLQMIGWVAKRHFSADTLRELVGHGFLTEKEYSQLAKYRDFLWKIRFSLHFLTNRREDRLLFNYQRELAAEFKFEDDEHQLGVEKFMKQYYRTVGELNRLNEMLLQLFQEDILYKGESETPKNINNRFQLLKGFIEVKNNKVFTRYPFALLEIFLLLEQNPEIKGVRAGTIRQIRHDLALIDDRFRNDLKCRSLFMEIIRQPEGITHELRRMHRYGVLKAYLPLFDKITGQMQYDLFHAYTVDEHTLFVVRNLRRFTVDEFSHEFPHCSEIIKQIAKPEILYLAGLFHDIAKGRSGDHSELGATEAFDFCQHHDMSKYDSDTVAWLVKQHLQMSRVSQREDISDPDVINRFADKVSNHYRLDYLYLLTIADMRATSPDVWSEWKGTLLRKLYDNTNKALRKRLGSISHEEQVSAIRQEIQQSYDNTDKQDFVKNLWKGISDDYFLRYTSSEIRGHIEDILSCTQSGEELPLVIVRDSVRLGGTEIFIHTRVSDKLFSIITSTLERLGLNIVDARIIHSEEGYTFDSYIVLEQNNLPIHAGARAVEVKQSLQNALDSDSLEVISVPRILQRQHRHFSIPTRISFDTDNRYNRTIMEVITEDRPGLLAKVGEALRNMDIELHNARISTFGLRAEDLFDITDSAGQPLNIEHQTSLMNKVIEKLDMPSQATIS